MHARRSAFDDRDEWVSLDRFPEALGAFERAAAAGNAASAREVQAMRGLTERR